MCVVVAVNERTWPLCAAPNIQPRSLFTLTRTLQSIRAMIRREPTMIPMSDSDVQDVRDLVATQTADYARKQQLMNQMKIMAERPLTDEEVPILMHVARQEKDRLERERRLGMEPGTSTGQTIGTDASISAHPQPGPSAADRARITAMNLHARMGTSYGINTPSPPGS